MTLHPGACDPRRLDQFLRQRPQEEFPRDLEAHLLVCPACRSHLDEVAGGHRWWTEVRQYLGDDGASEMSRTSDPAFLPTQVTIDLSFLNPSDNPASLGRLGDYEVLEVVGQGGMGIVLKAFDRALHRPVAIKVLAAQYAANGAARKRFEREARAVAAVTHDHVVPVHAVDADAKRPYLVMGMISGRSLQQRIDQSGPLELKEILRIGMQTASGLAAAHAQGLVHRDIKPANIMLENGVERVKITDFGLARAVDDSSITQNGVLTGTPQYMAPEQARGEAVDQRADLFSLGSTLYAMCTGRSPFRADSSLAAIKQVCETEPTRIRSLNPDIPAWLEGIVRKLHAKDPAARFQSAAEVADLLEHCLAHMQQPDRQPLPALAEELGRQFARTKPSRFQRWHLAVAGVLILAIGALIWALTRPGNGGSALIAALDPALVSGDEGIDNNLEQMKSRLSEMEHSLSAASPNENPDIAVGALQYRAEWLRRDLQANMESTDDPVESQLESIRRRLEQLRQDNGR
jgi:eukaryotic-like serine/threonine-protein kinase